MSGDARVPQGRKPRSVKPPPATVAKVLTLGKGRESRKQKPRRFREYPNKQPAAKWVRGDPDDIIVKVPAQVLKPTAARHRKFGINRQKEDADDLEAAIGASRKRQQERERAETIDLISTGGDSIGVGGRELPRVEDIQPPMRMEPRRHESPEPMLPEASRQERELYRGRDAVSASIQELYEQPDSDSQERTRPPRNPSERGPDSPSLRSISSTGTEDAVERNIQQGRLLAAMYYSPERTPSPPPSRHPFPFARSGPPSRLPFAPSGAPTAQQTAQSRAHYIREATARFQHTEKTKRIAERNTMKARDKRYVAHHDYTYSRDQPKSKRAERRADLEKWRAQKRNKQKQLMGVPQSATSQKKLQIQKLSAQEYMVRSSGLNEKVRIQVKQLIARVKKRMYVNGKYMTKKNALKTILSLLSEGQVVKIRFSK